MGKIEAATVGEEAKRIVNEANQRGVKLRLIGGVGILLQSQSIEVPHILKRNYVDLDFVGLSNQIPKLTKLFTELGYEPNRRFNAILGSERLLFSSSGSVDHIDVLIDRLRMCHTWDLRDRLNIDNLTLPVADLLLSKLQIVNVTEKDLKDIYLLLLQHELGANDQNLINTTYLSDLMGNNWGLWKTATINLKKAFEYLDELQFDQKGVVVERLKELIALTEDMKKSLGWKLRGIVGERVQWYELPGEVNQDPQ